MSGERYDSPNQQVVRPDGSGPGVEGTGGDSQPQVTSPPEDNGAEDELETMTKAELIAYADERGISVDQYATKDEIKATIREAE